MNRPALPTLMTCGVCTTTTRCGPGTATSGRASSRPSRRRRSWGTRGASEAHEVDRPFVAHANWLEIGWALRREFWGRGYAAEIGHAGLAYAFNVLGAHAVVSCTVRHNARSRAVMERIGMRYAGEIRSRGLVDGVEGERDDAPFAICVLLRKDWNRSAASGVSSSAAGGAVDLPSGPRLSRWLAGRLGVVSTGGDLTAAVVAQWRRAGPALAQVRRDELRRLTDAEALAAAEELLDLMWLLPPSTDASGLVEQQRLFAHART